jgi:hypothetical protein
MSKLKEYFEQYALLSLEKQDKLVRLIGEHYAELDLDAGKVRFGSNLGFPFQVLGTTSDNTLTWLWAWSEEQTEIPEDLMQSARELKSWGEREGIPEFFEPEVDLNRADGHMISLIASEVGKASCYYRDPYQGGALYLLLFGEAIDSQPPLDRTRLVHHLSELSTTYDLDHRKALLSYLRAKNLAFVENDRVVAGRLESGETLDVEFDDQGRLLSSPSK